MIRNFFSFLFRLSRPSVLHVTAPERAGSWLAAVMTVMVLPALFAMSSGCCQNDIRRIPTIRGRVVEAKTNRPIAGARLARWFEREDSCLAPGGSDVRSVAGSFLAVTTGKDGSFEWPAWTSLTSPIKTMRWYIYHPDWVAEDGWFNHPRSGLDGYFLGISGVEPWLHLDSHPVGSHLEVTLRMEPKDSTAAWEAHFQRMKSLTQYGKLDVEYFVKEAVAYVQRAQPLSDGIASRILELVGAPINERPITRDHDPQVLRLRKAIVDYCDQTPGSEFCSRSAVGIGYIRGFFQKEASRAR